MGTFSGNNWFTFFAFSVIAAVALSGNCLVIYVLVVRRKKFLDRPYSIFILNLAIVDFLTAIFLIFSRYLYLPPTPTYNDTSAIVFCQMIWSGRLPFDMGYISLYTCVALTIERWLAVVRPHTYRAVKTRHAIYAVIAAWLAGPVVNSCTYLRVTYSTEERRCAWTTIPFANDELPWISMTFQSILPCSIIIVLYGHTRYALKRLPRLTSNRDIQLRRVTIVALFACSLLTVGWLPGTITCMLSKFGRLDPDGSVHFTCVMITFLNSCVNPFLYGIYSPAFRAEYKEVFRYYWRRLRNVFRRTGSSKKNSGQGNDSWVSEKQEARKRDSVKPEASVNQRNSVTVQHGAARYDLGYAFTVKQAFANLANPIALQYACNSGGLRKESANITSDENESTGL